MSVATLPKIQHLENFELPTTEITPEPGCYFPNILESAQRASDEALALYRHLETQDRPTLERLAWIVFHEVSNSAETMARLKDPEDAESVMSVLDSMEKVNHIALSLYDLLTLAGLHKAAMAALRIYNEATVSAEALGEGLGVEPNLAPYKSVWP